MREYRFRGKVTSDSHSLKKNQWVYGSYFKDGNKNSWIFDNEEDIFYIVDEKTVGEYTGLKDRYGNDVYEGDIVEEYSYNKLGEIVWDKNSGMFLVKLKDFSITASGIDKCKKVGYIWDNYSFIEKKNNKKDEVSIEKKIYFEIGDIISKIRLNEIKKSEIKNKLINVNNVLRNIIFNRKIYIVTNEGFIQGVYTKKEVAQKVVLEGFDDKVSEYWIDDKL